jgi:integrase
VALAYETGWGIHGEVFPLEWRHIDFTGRGEVRLDPHSTKNDEGRVFPLTAKMRAMLERRRAETDQLQRETGTIIRWVFHRRGKRIKDFYTAWRTACRKAGCPANVPHDMCRSGIRNMVRAGRKTRSVLDRYNVVSESDLLGAAAQMDAAAAVTATVTKTVTIGIDGGVRKH